VGDGQVGPFPQDRGNQLQGAEAQACHFADFAFPGVVADQLVVQMQEICKLPHLKTVACRNRNRIITLLELFDDGSKKWNVRSVIQIDPDLSFGALRGMFFRICRR